MLTFLLLLLASCPIFHMMIDNNIKPHLRKGHTEIF